MSRNAIHDPCFGGGRDPRTVAWSNDPFSCNVVLIRLTQPLRKRSAASGGSTHPCVLRLANGAACQFLTGATGLLDGDRANYGCEPTGPAWSVKYSAASMPTPASVRRTIVSVAVF
jgi:hypothetical protein